MSSQPIGSPHVLVVGGTGLLGRSVVAALELAGARVRVLSRGIRRSSGLGSAEVVVGDIKKGQGLSEAMRGIDVVVQCAQPVDSVIDAALRADRPHIVYISIVGVDRIRFGIYPTKLADEQHLAGSGLPWSVLRATQFHDLVAGVVGALGKSPIILLPKDFRFQPVDVSEVGERLARLALEAPTRRIDELGGPEVRTMRSLAESVVAQAGRGRRIVEVAVPGAIGRAFRAGLNLAPEHADGRITFEDYLRRSRAAGDRPYAGVLSAYLSPRRLLRTFRPL